MFHSSVVLDRLEPLDSYIIHINRFSNFPGVGVVGSVWVNRLQNSFEVSHIQC